jgi:hypothetical protein
MANFLWTTYGSEQTTDPRRRLQPSQFNWLRSREIFIRNSKPLRLANGRIVRKASTISADFALRAKSHDARSFSLPVAVREWTRQSAGMSRWSALPPRNSALTGITALLGTGRNTPSAAGSTLLADLQRFRPHDVASLVSERLSAAAVTTLLQSTGFGLPVRPASTSVTFSHQRIQQQGVSAGNDYVKDFLWGVLIEEVITAVSGGSSPGWEFAEEVMTKMEEEYGKAAEEEQDEDPFEGWGDGDDGPETDGDNAERESPDSFWTGSASSGTPITMRLIGGGVVNPVPDAAATEVTVNVLIIAVQPSVSNPAPHTDGDGTAPGGAAEVPDAGIVDPSPLAMSVGGTSLQLRIGA